MDWLVVVVQWLHVLLGMFWSGNALVVAAFLIPTLNHFPVSLQREVGGPLWGHVGTRSQRCHPGGHRPRRRPRHPTWSD